MSNVAEKIGGAFAWQTAPFAVHALDRRRALEYLAAAMEAGVRWADAEAHIRAYLADRDCASAFIDEQVAKARPFLAPWLD